MAAQSGEIARLILPCTKNSTANDRCNPMDIRIDCPSKNEKTYSNQGSSQDRYSIGVSYRFLRALAPEQFVGKLTWGQSPLRLEVIELFRRNLMVTLQANVVSAPDRI